MTPSLAAVVLAHGSSAETCAAVVCSAARAGFQTVVVYQNAVVTGYQSDVERRLQHDRPQRLLFAGGVGRNLGSAGGYRAAMVAAQRMVPDLSAMLLLDDDTPVEGVDATHLWDCLQMLPDSRPRALSLRRWRKPSTTWSTLDRARLWQANAAFLGVDVWGKFGWRCDSATGRGPFLSWCAYAGLFIDVQSLQRIGYPDADFFLYGDDLEFTSRIVSTGGVLRVSEAGVVCDLRPSGLSLDRGDLPFAARVLGVTSNERLRLWLANEFRRHRLLGVSRLRLYSNSAVVVAALLAYALFRPAYWTAFARFIWAFWLAVGDGSRPAHSRDRST